MPNTRKRGARLSPRHILHAARSHRALAAPPPQFATAPADLQMWGNDTLGDCVSAEEAYAKLCTGQRVTDADLVAWAQSHGYANGADLYSVLSTMQSDGLTAADGNAYDDGQPSTVDWTDPIALQSAIETGPVKIAVAADQLENVVGKTNGWLLQAAYVDTDYDHCVSLSGYGPAAWLAQQLAVPTPPGLAADALCYLLFTWSTLGFVTAQSLPAITGEAWLRSPTTLAQVTPPAPPPDDPCRRRLSAALGLADRLLALARESLHAVLLLSLLFAAWSVTGRQSAAQCPCDGRCPAQSLPAVAPATSHPAASPAVILPAPDPIGSACRTVGQHVPLLQRQPIRELVRRWKARRG